MISKFLFRWVFFSLLYYLMSTAINNHIFLSKLFRKIVNDSRIQFRILDEFGVLPPSPISPVTSSSFRTIQKSVETVFNAPSGPSLMIGNTDTRWYWDLSKNIYRFSPLRIKVKDLSMFHGLNERIDIDSLADIVLFYAVLIMISCDQRDRIESSSRGD